MSWSLQPFCGVAQCVKVRQLKGSQAGQRRKFQFLCHIYDASLFDHTALAEPPYVFQGRDGSLIERVTDCGPEPKLPLPKGCVVSNLSQLQDNSTVLEYPKVRCS